MKTRSNDIIPNAPFKYNSDTNTLEIGTNLYVDGNISIQADLNTYGGIQSFNDSSLSFYQYEDTQSSYFDISPLFGQYELSFTHFDGQAITATATLKIDGDCNILTNINVKTLFGNQSIYGSGNIDLYRHILKLGGTAASGQVMIFYGIIESPNNLKVDSLQDLTTLTKALSGTSKIVATLANYSNGYSGILKWDGTIWKWSGAGGDVNITTIEDTVETI